MAAPTLDVAADPGVDLSGSAMVLDDADVLESSDLDVEIDERDLLPS
jgi:hypothetical protein